MNYKLIHDSIIDRAKSRVLPKEVYTERHHIIPRCMGGSDDKSNLVDLTAKEHFIVHKLLVEMYPNIGKLINALWKMTTRKDSFGRNYKIGSSEYERHRILFVNNHPNKNLEFRKWQSNRMKGVKQRPCSYETKTKIGLANKGKKRSEQVIENHRKKLTGRKKPEHSKRMSGDQNPSSRILLDIVTGIYYLTLKDAAFSKSMNYTYLCGVMNQSNKKNKTNLVYV